MDIMLYVKHYQSSAGLVRREVGNLNGLDEYQINHIQIASPVPKSVEIRHTTDRKENVFATVLLLFSGHYKKLNPRLWIFLCVCAG